MCITQNSQCVGNNMVDVQCARYIFHCSHLVLLCHVKYRSNQTIKESSRSSLRSVPSCLLLLYEFLFLCNFMWEFTLSLCIWGVDVIFIPTGNKSNNAPTAIKKGKASKAHWNPSVWSLNANVFNPVLFYFSKATIDLT